MLEDESAPLPPDPRTDAIFRVIFGAILLFGGGFFALEFVHWLAHGGLPKFLLGLLIASALFLILVIWSQFLSAGSRLFRTMPVVYATVGFLTALGFLAIHFMST